MAKVSIGKFIREVGAERARIVWPSGRETMMTTVMVVIMTTVLGSFFFGVDRIFTWIVQSLLKLI